MNRVVMGLRYCGQDFEGWQTQPHGRTVQDHLILAIEKIAAHRPVVYCAGRTDTGVHAREQVVHFDTPQNRPLSAWVKGVNTFLPGSVVVTGATLKDEQFHARFSAISRTYRYFFYSARVRDPFKPYMTWVHHPLSIEAMQCASVALLGTHDFTSFRAAQCQSKTPVKTLHSIEFVPCDDHVYVEIRGNAFLHHMVRNIMGTLFEVGLGRQQAPWVAEVLNQRNRSLAAKTAPAQGLTLWHVQYPERDEIDLLFRPMEFGAPR
jgi:tRNA pseudouridine38-40 synthase